jgi:hypothetical protein
MRAHSHSLHIHPISISYSSAAAQPPIFKSHLVNCRFTLFYVCFCRCRLAIGDWYWFGSVSSRFVWLLVGWIGWLLAPRLAPLISRLLLLHLHLHVASHRFFLSPSLKLMLSNIQYLQILLMKNLKIRQMYGPFAVTWLVSNLQLRK